MKVKVADQPLVMVPLLPRTRQKYTVASPKGSPTDAVVVPVPRATKTTLNGLGNVAATSTWNS